MTNEETVANQQIVASIMGNPSIAKIYTNGFITGVSAADMFVVLQSAAIPVAVIQMSYNTAKTLALELTRMVERIEVEINQSIPTMHDIQPILERRKGG